jgi:hypothetical protein
MVDGRNGQPASKLAGDNRVGLIFSQTANKVSKTMGEAAAARPRIVGETLNAVGCDDPDILQAVLDVMEVEKLLESGATIELIPPNIPVLMNLA